MNTEYITLAGGCFWCLEAAFRRISGVVAVQSGYSNGQAEKPSYEQVCSGASGCAEVVRLQYDPSLIGVQEILRWFFMLHDPTQLNGQGADIGTQYRSGIYYENAQQKAVAQAMLERLRIEKVFEREIVTELQPMQNYFAAEPHHQNYFDKNQDNNYCRYVIAPKLQHALLLTRDDKG